MTWFVIMILLFLTSSAVRAEELPRLNIEAMCRAAPRLGESEKSVDQACVRDETEARNRLEQQWSSYDSRQRNMCIEQTKVGGSPSYVDVLTCLEMAGANPSTTGSSTPRRR